MTSAPQGCGAGCRGATASAALPSPKPQIPASAEFHEENPMACSVLLIAPEPAASVVANALRRDLDGYVELSAHGRESLSALRREEFTLILLDENLAAAEPGATDNLYTGAGAAPVLEMNFAICGVDRVLRQVRSALSRRAQNEAKARSAAANALGNELNASLAGLLLESQLALREAGPELAPALKHLIELAAELREQLRA